MMNVYLGCVPWSDDPDQDQWFEISQSSHGIQWTNESLIPRVDWSVPLAWYDLPNLLYRASDISHGHRAAKFR